VASPVCLRLSLAVCALHAYAVFAVAQTPASLASTTKPPSLAEQAFTQAIDLAPLLDNTIGGEPCATLLYLRVSSDYLSKRFEKEVNRTKPVVDLILGTRIRGESLTRGKTRMVLIPNDDKFVAEIEFVGTVNSRTRGTNGPAILHYKSDSTFRATKRITLDADGLSVDPARATAKTKLTPQRIDSKYDGLMGMIVERVARRRVAESRQQANAIASDHTGDIVKGDLDRGFEKSITVLVAALAEAAGLKPAELAQLTTNGAGRSLHLKLRTTRDHAELVLAPEEVTWTELAGVIPAVDFPDNDGSPHVALRVHRTALTSSGENSSGSPALARLLAHGMKTHLAKRSAAVVELPAKTSEHPINWSIDLNWLCVDVCREQPNNNDVLRAAQLAAEPPTPSADGAQ
jgi:hypothetical protein